MSHGAWLLLAWLAVAQPNAADGAHSDLIASQQKKWHEFYARQAASYEICLSDNSRTPLELKPSAVLYWSNPVRIGETNGAVFVWTHNGRAEAVGTIFSFLDRRDPQQRVIAHSFHSLSTIPLSAVRDDQPSWSIAVGGIQPQPIANSPEPANTPSQRLLQMRELAREFTATTVQDGVERELRLLPQPIYRNDRSADQSLDGALFTFVTGTDPELMLLIDVRPSATGPRWHFAAARFTDLTAKLSHKQTEVWHYDRSTSAEDGKSPYITGRFAKHPSVLD